MKETSVFWVFNILIGYNLVWQNIQLSFWQWAKYARKGI